MKPRCQSMICCREYDVFCVNRSISSSVKTVISFFPLPDFCPMMMKKLLAVGFDRFLKIQEDDFKVHFLVENQ